MLTLKNISLAEKIIREIDLPMQTADAEANRVSDGFESPDFLSPAAGQYKLLSIFSRDIPQRLFLSRSTCNMRYWHDFAN